MTSVLAIGSPGDAPLEYTLAGRGRRLVSYLIDLALFAAISLPRLLFRPAGAGGVGDVIANVLLLAYAGLQIWLLAIRGQTPGKIVMKVAIVDPETALPPGYLRAAVIRQGPQSVLSLLYPLIGGIYSIIDALLIFSSRRRCLHDRLARTVVIAVSGEWP